jgi:hypothetical protein
MRKTPPKPTRRETVKLIERGIRLGYQAARAEIKQLLAAPDRKGGRRAVA